MVSKLPILVLAVASLLFAGCMGADSDAALVGQGMTSGERTDTTDCGAQGELSWAIQGMGKVRLRVVDARAIVIYDSTISMSGGGQEAGSTRISGAEGTWTLKAEFSSGSSGAMFSGGGSDEFQGQWAINLNC